MPDEYDNETFRWWHLSGPSPELLEAIEDRWLCPAGRVLDVGCGLGSELAHLASIGWRAVGVDLSVSALQRARHAHQDVAFTQADATRLPFPADSFDAVLDRGCFHYLPPAGRITYLAELERVLRPAGRLLLRACLRSAGRPNDVSAIDITQQLTGWRLVDLRREDIPSDTRTMPAVVARLERR
jgi:SAM-dependent methyltransferase